MSSETIAAAALRYFRRGWKLVAVGRKSKQPIAKGWQKRAFHPAQFKGNALNLGIQFGETSNGLCDVDLDSMLAIRLAPNFLPTTEAIFGRPSKPCSHHLYVSDLYRTEKVAAIQYKLFQNNDKAGASVVELRIGGHGKGAMSVVPPSIHVTGESVAWVRDGEPARVDGAVLKQSVRKLAIACLLLPGYHGSGSRHEGALVLGGVLARAEWSADEIGHLVQELATAAGDDEVGDRVTAAASAVTAMANGQIVAGLPRLGELWGGDCADTLKRWLKLSVSSSENGVGREDCVALDFAARHADDLRYVAKSSQWMRWGGETWQSEDTLAAFDISRRLCRAAGDGKAKTVAAVVTLARTDRRMAARVDQWDRDPMLLNTKGSTVDLTTGISRPPDSLDYLTKQAGTTVAISGAPHPLWTQFLNKVTSDDDELIDFLQCFAGYCLTGDTGEHKLLFVYGPGANGKGVFVNTLARVMGDYAISAPIEMFLASKHDRHPTEVARLNGARLVVAQETEKGRRWDETKLKVLTSSDRLSAHFMRQDYFDFDPTHKLLITGNHKPSLDSVDEAMRRRLLLVPFTVQIPVNERDPDLAAKLVPEHPAILRWMVEGCLRWRRDRLVVPEKVRKVSDDYFASQDTLGQWIDDCLAVGGSAFTTTRVLFTSWEGWAEARNASVGSEKAFVEALTERRFEQHRKSHGRGFNGLALKTDDVVTKIRDSGGTDSDGCDGSSLLTRIRARTHA